MLFFSLEMSSEQLATRILSERAKINSDDLRTGKNLNENSNVLLFGCEGDADEELYQKLLKN